MEVPVSPETIGAFKFNSSVLEESRCPVAPGASVIVGVFEFHSALFVSCWREKNWVSERAGIYNHLVRNNSSHVFNLMKL